MRPALTGLAVLAFALATVLHGATIARASEPIATTDLGAVSSRAEISGNPIMRDGGISVQYSSRPPRSLWLFGDTQPDDSRTFIGGTTAAIGVVAATQAPTDLLEVPTPPTRASSPLHRPQAFFPVPVGLTARNGLPCGVPGSDSLYAAAWPSGGARIPGSDAVLLTYLQVCVARNSFPSRRLTLTIYDARKNQLRGSQSPFVAQPSSVSLSAREILGSPVFGKDGYLYLFAFDPHHVYVARVAATPASWGDAQNFRWWSEAGDGAGAWTHDESSATSIVAGAPAIYGISAGDYSSTTLHKYVLLIQTGFRTGEFALFGADSPQGPWTAGPIGRLPDTCAIGAFGCYAEYGHPELSTRQSLVFSWFSPGARPSSGRVRVAAVHW